MKIIILDKATIGNDIDLRSVEEYGEIISYDYTTPNQTFERISDADIVISNKVYIGEKQLETAKKLKLICVAATGYNNIDIKEANKRNIPVTNVKGYSTDSVAQLVFANLLTIYNSTFQFNTEIKSGNWQKSQIFTMLSHPFFELKNKTLGIIGYGTIGKKVEEIGKAFGMKILIAKSLNTNKNETSRVDLQYLISESDVVTLHIPLNENTKNLISLSEIVKMKKSAVLINAARGGIVNENDLYIALKNNLIRAAIVDVMTTEPPLADNKLFELDNILITPHIAWTSKEARQRLIDGISNNIKIFTEGNINNIKILQ